ncbi:MAG: DUF4167 domain-containing protein [Candidatus Tokpelaia sp.]|nr:MAG: DUF4167 domain-containing protein [Candidatus Tokpelaia sp.]KAA6206357.1 MAG: DUF4167 domain-containing protein [Candidatus Tokpelaia sp.]
MRPQQNRRLNRRSNNNGLRRAPNPLTRNYESSGPDVKIRGNAQHIADKYLALARDAQASGDRVMGENYLQHAEHYLRIIFAAQPGEKDNKSSSRADNEVYGAEDAESADSEELAEGAQPVIDGLPGEVVLMDKRGSYNKADNGSDYEAEEEKYGRVPPRRRLPARRSNQAARQPNRLRREEGEPPAQDKGAARPAYDGRNIGVQAGGAAGEAALASMPSAQLRKPRRQRAVEEGETEQPDI